jgi:hypothetical protein
MHTVSVADSKMHFTFRLLQSQQLRAPLRSLLRFASGSGLLEFASLSSQNDTSIFTFAFHYKMADIRLSSTDNEVVPEVSAA